MTRDEYYNDKNMGQLRYKSRELDYGVWWRNAHSYPTYRVTFVIDAHELIAVELQHSIYEVLATIDCTEAEMDRLLDGWADQCCQLNSLQWVRDRVAL